MAARVLLISSNSSGRGGGEQYLVHLTRGLRSIGCDVRALLSSVEYMDVWDEKLRAEGARVRREPLRGLRHRPLRFVQSIADRAQQRLVAQVCREAAPDAILVNQQYDEDGLDYVAGALRSGAAPVGGLMHNPMTATKNSRPLGRLRGRALAHWYRRHPYALILVSEGSRRDFETYYEHPRPTRVVHHGIVFSEEARGGASLPPGWGADGALPVVGFTGQFEAVKNLGLLVESWLWMRARGADSRLLLIGDGPERARLERLLGERAPRDRWHVTGWQENPQAFVPFIDVFAMTSHTEGCPLALLDAVGRGVPAVVTDFNGASDVAGRAPWVSLVAEPRPPAVGGALVKTVGALHGLKRRAREGAPAFREYFSLRRMAEDTVAAICR